VSAVSVGSQLNTIVYGNSGTVSYKVTVNTTGSGNTTVNFNVTGLPSGITASWKNAPPITISSSPGTDTLILTVAAGTKIPVSSPVPFKVIALVNNSAKDSATGSLATTARALTVTATGINKVYNGNTKDSVTSSDNRVSGDVFNDSYTSATFNDKNVGTAKPVSVSGISITGTDAGNYTFNNTASTTANITARALTVSATGINKVYDGNTKDTVTLSDNRVSGDVFTDSYTTASFADKNVGNGKTVSVSGISITGTDAGNYTFNNTASTTANITARALTVTATGINKVYDANTKDTVTLSDNRVSGDVFTDSYTTASFADKNVANGKTVSVSGISITGTDAGNYTFNNTASTTANITARALTVTATGINKVYDGNTKDTVTLSDNRISGDVFSDSYTSATFNDKNVGTAKPVSVTGISIIGTDAGNYTANTSAATTANITAKALTITATGINKVYDGNTKDSVTLSDNRVSGDVVADSYTSALFNDKNVGTAKPVSVSGISITGTDAGNYTANTSAATTADITAKTLTITATGINKVYDGNTKDSVTLSDNRVSGDVVADSYTSALFNDKNVGTAKPVSVSGISITGTDAGNYAANTSAATTADITAKALTITATGINKVYDGNTKDSVTLSDNRVSGDVFNDSYTSATFNDKNVGTAKQVSVSGISITGTDAGNYTANTSAATTANITAKTLTVTATGINKVYDGNTKDTVTLSDNRVSGDVFNDSYTAASFADKNVANGKTVSVSGISITGTDAGNYTFNNTASTTANITVRALTVTATGINKVYDGNTKDTVTLSDNRVSGDVFNDSYTSATFNDKNVGTAKPVSVTGISISGNDANNYTANTSAATTANITTKTLTVTATGINKVYDGNTKDTVTLSDNRVSGDVFTDAYTSALFNDRNVGTAKPVSVTGLSISGTDAGNYTFNNTASTTANITARALTVTATGINKVYDSNTKDSVTLSDNRVSGDVVADSYTSALFNDKNVGSAKPVSVTGISISGTDASNYTFNNTASTTANITARALTVTATGINKVYDGNTKDSVTLSDNRVSGDLFNDSYTSATFNDKNVGTAKPVSVSGISISGTDAGNYTANTSAATTADITAKTLTITATGINKVYDGNTKDTVTLSDNRVSGDVVTDSYTSALFNDRNVGTAKPVSVTGLSISGTDAGNYTANTSAATSADITAKALIVTATGINKVYDGNTKDSVTLSDNRVSGDVFTDAYTSALFNDKNVGTAKPVSVSGISITGTDAGNYAANTSAATTADITAKALTITATGINKVYDGNAKDTVTLSDNRVTGDVFMDSYTSALFNDKNVGTEKPVSVTGISISGTDASNYTFNNTASTTANITARALTVTATGINKVYDGNTKDTVTLSDNRVSGDVVTDSYTFALFNDRNVGTAKPVSVTGISISGTDAGNYTANTSAATTADITAKALTITATGINKVYDGNTKDTVTLSDNRVSGDVVTDSYTSALFNDRNVGTAKPVSVTGISISGTDAGNYTANTSAATSADITAKALTITATGINKVYDGNTKDSVTLSDNRVSGDVFSDSYTSATFNDKNVGTAKPVSVSGISITGTDAGNYTANTSAATSADITAKALIVTATGINKVYDGNTKDTVTLSDNRVSGDAFTDAYTSALFNDKNVGTAKPVSVTGISINGTDASNYTFNNTASTTANITARALTVTATGINKVYDGNTKDTVTLSDNRVSGDVFNDSYTSATFNDKNVGTAKPVSVTGISITGTDAGNYTANTSAATTANITAKALTITATGINKVYDGNTKDSVTLSDNRVSGDVVADSYTSALFNDKNVGTAKPVSVTGISISGTDAGNYTANTSAATSADITAKALIVTATGINKVYDGNTKDSVTLSDNRVSGDVFTDAYIAALFNDKNVGTAKPVSVTGISISGTDAGNYTANTSAATSADITAKALIVTATGINKVYDGNAKDTVTLSDNRVSGDVFTEAYTTASFNDKNVGTAKPVSVTGMSISGTDAGNYTANTSAATMADITAKALTITATGINKVYDGNTKDTVTLSDNRVSGDVFTEAYTSALFNDKNVGTAKPVSVAGISISGTDANNYTANTSAATTANITAKTLTVTATGINKVYDGNTKDSVTLSDNRVSGDVVADSYTSALFNDKNVGSAKPVSVTGISITGTDAGNYAANTSAATTADITAKALTITATGINKVYDGNTKDTVTLSDNRVSGDVFTDAYTAALFNDKNVGTAKPVSVTGISISGTDAGNYTANTSAATSADITAKALIVTATGINKVYDGNTKDSVTLSDNRVSGDVFTDAYTSALFNDKNVGTAKPVSVTGISISGTDAGNYTANTSAATSADITAKALIVTATGINKVYDGNAKDTVTLSDNRVTGDVFMDSYTSALFNDKNVGTAKPVSVTGISISGTDAGNYTANTSAATTANITAKALTITATGINKVYDGNTKDSVTLSDNRVSGDVFMDSYISALFNDKNVGTAKPVSVSGISITGTDAGNYTANTSAATTADITAKALTITATGINKVYDGNTKDTVTLSDNRVSGDVFTDAYTSALFNDKNVGTAKPVSVTGISISGTDANNYTANTSAATTANITALAITGSITASNKVYDGNTADTISGRSLSGKISGDVVSYIGGTANFADKNVGTGKLVTATGLSLTGTDASNYTVNTTATTTANITPKYVTAAITASNKPYDGTTTASATGSVPTGIISGDMVNVIVTNANFANATYGTWPVTANVALGGAQGGNYTLTSNIASTTATITPLIVNTNVYVGPNPQQYSDTVTYTAKITGGAPLVVNGPHAAQSVTFKVGTQTVAAKVPFIISGADLIATYKGPLLEPTPFGTAPTGQMAPGIHTVTASITGADPDFSLSSTSPATSLTITPEDARITYTGPLNAATTSSTSTTAVVTLSATIQDISATPYAAGDNSPGDIRNATVTFINRDNNTIIAANVPVGLVNTNDTKTGTAVYNWNNASIGQYTIGIIVNNYYTRNSSADDQVINIYQPNGDFITGGGYLVLTNSNGLKAGDAGSKNNFGFNVKYNKSGTNLQGNINTIIQRTESGVIHTYQVKGNSMTSLSVDPNVTTAHPYPTAIFNGKATIQDITNPLSPISVDGNATLQVNMTDEGDPGSNDMIGIVVYNKSGGVWFSSNWNGVSTVQQTLGGGNLVVHGSAYGSSTTTARTTETTTQAAAATVPPPDHFAVKVLGNPAVMYFNVLVESSKNDEFEMKIYDIMGRHIQTVRGTPGTPIQIGEAFMKGHYILEVKQGNNYQTVTIVKI
jgi:hypothetical protein